MTKKIQYWLMCTLAAAALAACGDGSGDACPSGQVDCDGTCVQTSYDPGNCGACGNMCSADSVCNAGNCEGSCGTGTTECSQACVDTQLDPTNCGACGTTCDATEVCSAGSCGTECIAGATACSGMCVDTDVDYYNCGSCGNVCAKGESCNAGTCGTCAAPRTTCGNSCVNTQTDESNCGGCGTMCTEGQACVSGSCAAAARSVAVLTGSYNGSIGQDLFVSYDGAPSSLTQINTVSFDTDTVVEFKTLSNGDIIFRGAQDTEGVLELYRAPAGGGAVVKLSGALVSGGNVAGGFVISDDESRVLYLADGATDEVWELYLVTIASPGTATKLNGPLISGGDVMGGFVISADNSTVAYLADETVDGDIDAYAVSTSSPTTSVRLSPPGNARRVDQVGITSNGATVVYIAAQATTTAELHSVAVASPATITRLDTNTTHTDSFQLATDNRVVYIANKGTQSLHYVDLDNPDVPTKLNAGNNSIASGFTVTGSGTRVIYRGRAVANGPRHLVYVNIATPGVAVNLSSAAGANEVSAYAVRRDGTAVVYSTGSTGGCVVAQGCVSNGNEPGFNELYYVETATPATQVLISNPDEDIYMRAFTVSADGTRVAYEGEDGGFVRAYVVDVSTAQTHEIDIALQDTNRDVSTVEPNPAGDKVYVRGDLETDGSVNLYEISLASPGTLTRINGSLTPEYGAAVHNFKISADGTRVVYQAEEDTFSQPELYFVNVASPGTSTKLSQTLGGFGDIGNYMISRDSSRVFFLADLTGNNAYELYTVAFATPATVTKLSSALVAGGSVSRFVESNDGNFVIYRADQETDGTYELYRVALASPGTSTKVSAAGGASEGPWLSHNDAFVLYIDAGQLWMVTLTNPTVATQLNGTLTTGGAVRNQVVIGSTNATVYYLADQTNDDRVELYSVQVASPGASTRLNPAMPSVNTDVLDFKLTPDETKIVYRADHLSSIDQLYLVDLGSPGTSTLLNQASASASLDVYQYYVTDTSVTYRADFVANGAYELYSSSFSSPGTSTRLTWSVLDGDVHDLRLSNGNAIYRGDGIGNGMDEAYFTPADGSGSQTTLTPYQGPTDVISVQVL